MNNGGRMEILEGFGQLVNDKPDMYIFEYALGNHIMKICFHELKQQIDIFVVVCANRFKQFYDVGVLKLFEDLDLAVGTLGVSCVLKSIKNFF